MDRSFAASAVRVWAAAALALRRSLDVEACGRLRNHAILDALVVLHSRHEGILPSPRRVRRAPPLRAYLESSRRGVLGQRCPAPPEDLTALDPLPQREDLRGRLWRRLLALARRQLPFLSQRDAHRDRGRVLVEVFHERLIFADRDELGAPGSLRS